MSTVMSVELKAVDVYQIIDALNARACAYEKTARYLRGEQTEDEFIISEDCKDSDEAKEIAHHFRDIVVAIEGQINVRH
jgi:hypothetical protein